MALQTSGSISLGDLQDEFGGLNPIRITEYYRGGAYVPSTRTTTSSSTTSEGPFYSLSFPEYGWAIQEFPPYETVLYWNGVIVFSFDDSDFGVTSSITIGNTIYYRVNFVVSGIPSGGSTYSVYTIRREITTTTTTTVNINTSVPTDGQISLGDFYGATAT